MEVVGRPWWPRWRGRPPTGLRAGGRQREEHARARALGNGTVRPRPPLTAMFPPRGDDWRYGSQLRSAGHCGLARTTTKQRWSRKSGSRKNLDPSVSLLRVCAAWPSAQTQRGSGPARRRAAAHVGCGPPTRRTRLNSYLYGTDRGCPFSLPPTTPPLASAFPRLHPPTLHRLSRLPSCPALLTPHPRAPFPSHPPHFPSPVLRSAPPLPPRRTLPFWIFPLALFFSTGGRRHPLPSRPPP